MIMKKENYINVFRGNISAHSLGLGGCWVFQEDNDQTVPQGYQNQGPGVA